ncbi:MAG: hypothetical protein AAGJ35_16175, partial [Myxococcota bacterium]
LKEALRSMMGMMVGMFFGIATWTVMAMPRTSFCTKLRIDTLKHNDTMALCVIMRVMMSYLVKEWSHQEHKYPKRQNHPDPNMALEAFQK